LSVVEDIVTYLQTSGIGTKNTDIFGYSMPETPNNCIVVYPTGGYPRDKAGFIEYPTIMIHVRNELASTAESKINAILEALHRVVNTTMNGTRYLSVYARDEGVSLGKDDQQRSTWSVNFEITV